MVLKNELYRIKEKIVDGSETVYDIELNPEHFIYKAHFPGEPITPGVCIIQIAKELLEELLGVRLNTATVKNVKFLSVISPQPSETVSFRIAKIVVDDAAMTVKSQIVVTSSGVAKTKMSMTCAILK